MGSQVHRCADVAGLVKFTAAGWVLALIFEVWAIVATIWAL